MKEMFLLALFVIVAGGAMFFWQGRRISHRKQMPLPDHAQMDRIADKDHFFHWASVYYYVNSGLTVAAAGLFLLSVWWEYAKYGGLLLIVVCLVRVFAFPLRARKFYK